jgi:hypothetical protein
MSAANLALSGLAAVSYHSAAGAANVLTNHFRLDLASTCRRMSPL